MQECKLKKQGAATLSGRRLQTTGDYRRCYASICGWEISTDIMPVRTMLRVKSISEIIGAILDEDSGHYAKRVDSLQKILSWMIIHCDTVPKEILGDTRMSRFVWDVLGCRKGLPDQATLETFIDALYCEYVMRRNDLLRQCSTCQISVTIKSYRNAAKSVEQIMAANFRLQDGKSVFGWIGKSSLFGETSVKNLSSMLMNNKTRSIVRGNQSGYVVDSSCSLQICQYIESCSPTTIAFPCQAYALGKLLSTMIQSDIYLQEMLQECWKIYEQAVNRNLCSADLICEVCSLEQMLRTKAWNQSKVHLCAYMLCIDKLRDDWGVSTFSHRVAFSPENVHFWTQLASYATLLEPFILCIASMETDEPSLGQVHSLWHDLNRHIDLWCDTIDENKKAHSYSMNCFSTGKIKQHFLNYRRRYHHPAFTLGHLLDCRLWSVSLGVARPNASLLSYDEIGKARELASRMSQHPDDVSKELTNLVQYGVKDDDVGILKKVSCAIHHKRSIQADASPKQMYLLRKAWGIDGSNSTLKQCFPRLSALFSQLAIMKGTTDRSKSIPSVLRWLVKKSDREVPYDSAYKMACIALSCRVASGPENPSAMAFMNIPRPDIEEAQKAIENATRNDHGQKATRQPCHTTPGITRDGNSLPDGTGQNAPLLQLTDQTNTTSLDLIHNGTVPCSIQYVACTRASKAVADQKDGDQRRVIRKNLMSDFDLSLQPLKKTRTKT